MSARRVAAGEVNPAAEPAFDLRTDRSGLVDALAAYNGVADRTHVTVRTTYLDRVLATLDRRTSQTTATSSAANSESKDVEFGSLSETIHAEEIARAALGDSQANDANGTANKSGVRFAPDVDPVYLSLGGLDSAAVPTVA